MAYKIFSKECGLIPDGRTPYFYAKKHIRKVSSLNNLLYICILI